MSTHRSVWGGLAGDEPSRAGRGDYASTVLRASGLEASERSSGPRVKPCWANKLIALCIVSSSPRRALSEASLRSVACNSAGTAKNADFARGEPEVSAAVSYGENRVGTMGLMKSQSIMLEDDRDNARERFVGTAAMAERSIFAAGSRTQKGDQSMFRSAAW
jgi:hypothetical protein